jgi:SAM-dependent methyltransferase
MVLFTILTKLFHLDSIFTRSAILTKLFHLDSIFTRSATTDSQAHNANDMITQTLNGESYTLRASPKVSWFQSLAKGLIGVAILPFLIPTTAFWIIGMFIPNVRDYLSSVLVSCIMNDVDYEFRSERKALLHNVSGRVLDVGSGGGAYMQYYLDDDVKELVAVEPNKALHPRIRRQGRHLGRLTIIDDLRELKKSDKNSVDYEESFDWVVFGNVLCEVQDVSSTLAVIDSLLKPGGRIYFSEHVAALRGTWKRWLQDWINPVWKHVGGGCNCNRDTLEALKNHYHPDIVYWTYDHRTVCLGPFVLGLAMKRAK